MARKCKIDHLPPEVRTWLENALANKRHVGYRALSAMLKEKGYSIHEASLWRYDKRIQKAMSAVREQADVAKLIVQACPDEKDEHSAAIIRLVQVKLFEAMIKMSEAEGVDPKERLELLSRAGRVVAEISRASIGQKRWQDEVRARLDALEAEQDKGQKRLDAETLKRVREALYGG